MPAPHASDSAAQRSAEAVIVELLAADLGVGLEPGGRIPVGGGAYVQVDARATDGSVLVEAYARQGALRGGQLKKIGQDVLKLALLRQQPAYAGARAIIAFASPEAVASIVGWVKVAAAEFGIELIAVELPEEVRAGLLEAQARQTMVNLLSTDEGADEMLADSSGVKAVGS